MNINSISVKLFNFFITKKTHQCRDDNAERRNECRLKIDQNYHRRRKQYGMFPIFLRNIDQDCKKLVTNIKGQIPNWLSGELYCNGPGVSTWGADRYNHIFEHSAVIKKFVITENKITYQHCLLESESQKINNEKNAIVVSELVTFGTVILNSFRNFSNLFNLSTDNANVTFFMLKDELYVTGETPFYHRIDCDNLRVKKSLNMRHQSSIVSMIGHTHSDESGAIYLMGNSFTSYIICKMIATDKVELVGSVPVRQWLTPSYFHSFGICENYFLFIEQPLVINIPSVMLRMFYRRKKFLNYRKDQQNRFYLVSRETGHVYRTQYLSDAFFFFHIINCYEKNDEIIVDIITYDDESSFNGFYHSIIEKSALNQLTESDAANAYRSRVTRFILPLKTEQDLKSGDIHWIKGERLIGDKVASFIEMPQINYAFNGRYYRYFYGICRRCGDYLSQLIKVDLELGKVLTWEEENSYPSEPIFVANPNGITEDDGVLLSSVVSEIDENAGYLLILDGITFREITRAEFSAKSRMKPHFHGLFKARKN